VGKNRTSTIADQVIDDLEPAYQAPECFKDPTQASIASALYATGLIFYELLTGELPFENVDQMMEADGRFPVKPSEHKPDLPKGIDEWLQRFCESTEMWSQASHLASVLGYWLPDVHLRVAFY